MEIRHIEEEREKVSKALSERLEAHDESRKTAQEKLQEICGELRAQIEGLEGKVGGELEEKFNSEDNRLQTALSELDTSEDSEASKMVQKAKAELLVMQSYDVIAKKEGWRRKRRSL